MSSSLIIGLEMAGVLGVVLAWGFWELWTLKRDKAKDAEAAKKEQEKLADREPPASPEA